MSRPVAWWLAVGWIGYAILPWYAIEAGFWGFSWLPGWFDANNAPALVQSFAYGRWWLLPVALALLAPLALLGWSKDEPGVARLLIVVGTAGLAWLVLQGFAVGLKGWSFGWMESLFGPLGNRQFGMGYGALLVAGCFIVLLTQGLAGLGYFQGDGFTAGSIGVIIATIAAFVFYPVFIVLVSAAQDNQGNFAPALFVSKILDQEIWGLDCVYSSLRCGVAWNSLFLAVLVGVGTTVLGLAFALVAVRSGFRFKRILRVLTVLPIITPPFVIGLAVILMFGRSGAVTMLLSEHFGIAPSRWIYGLPGVFMAQMLAFTPIAFLVMIGVVQGISPSLEEAALTLRADRWRTFKTVSLPLMRPGLANAFLLGFIESLADFGNPLVLGGNYDVLSTKIFFAVVGAQHDQGRAAVLSIILLVFTLSAFYAQRQWLGKKSYATVTGKGDAGLPVPLPARAHLFAYGLAVPWALFTAVVYVMILLGGFVQSMGRNHDFTLRHYVAAFQVGWTEHGIHFSGAAWNSFWTTLEISLLAAPLTAALGLLTAYVLVRQKFAGKDAFEFGTMLSFAIPGTVIGISYILAFNTPPIELTGTGVILVICFIFRNMPVGVRAGIAAMSQIDKSLDEASLTLGARSFTTMRRIIMPLLRPAVVASLVYAFVRAMTAVSAVIFLVTAQYEMATAYIVGRVEAGDYGLAIAYCSALIVVMIVAILLIQVLVGERKLGRRSAAAPISSEIQGSAAA
ncbi:MAG: iron ABC transporter permease [Alphaproteobacteria bacterium]|nr:iron ABC transporter permease [Alphaproteobacteria bacterium]